MASLRFLLLLLSATRASAVVLKNGLQPASSYVFVKTPQPERYEGIQSRADAVDMQKFVLTRTKSPTDAAKNLTIMAYPWKEDVGVSGDLNQGLGWETDHTKQLCALWEKEGMKGNFLDVGANIGTYTVPLADCARDFGGEIISIEGMPDIADHLRASIVANKQSNVVLY